MVVETQTQVVTPVTTHVFTPILRRIVSSGAPATVVAGVADGQSDATGAGVADGLADEPQPASTRTQTSEATRARRK